MNDKLVILDYSTGRVYIYTDVEPQDDMYKLLKKLGFSEDEVEYMWTENLKIIVQ